MRERLGCPSSSGVYLGLRGRRMRSVTYSQRNSHRNAKNGGHVFGFKNLPQESPARSPLFRVESVFSRGVKPKLEIWNSTRNSAQRCPNELKQTAVEFYGTQLFNKSIIISNDTGLGRYSQNKGHRGETKPTFTAVTPRTPNGIQ